MSNSVKFAMSCYADPTQQNQLNNPTFEELDIRELIGIGNLNENVIYCYSGREESNNICVDRFEDGDDREKLELKKKLYEIFANHTNGKENFTADDADAANTNSSCNTENTKIGDLILISEPETANDTHNTINHVPSNEPSDTQNENFMASFQKMLENADKTIEDMGKMIEKEEEEENSNKPSNVNVNVNIKPEAGVKAAEALLGEVTLEKLHSSFIKGLNGESQDTVENQKKWDDYCTNLANLVTEGSVNIALLAINKADLTSTILEDSAGEYLIKGFKVDKKFLVWMSYALDEVVHIIKTTNQI